jgi:hypothetical protein
VPAARVVGTSATIDVFENEATVSEVPPTVTVGLTPVGLKFEPVRVSLPVVKFTVASSTTGVCAWLTSGTERTNNKAPILPADDLFNLQCFIESSEGGMFAVTF